SRPALRARPDDHEAHNADSVGQYDLRIRNPGWAPVQPLHGRGGSTRTRFSVGHETGPGAGWGHRGRRSPTAASGPDQAPARRLAWSGPGRPGRGLPARGTEDDGWGGPGPVGHRPRSIKDVGSDRDLLYRPRSAALTASRVPVLGIRETENFF